MKTYEEFIQEAYKKSYGDIEEGLGAAARSAAFDLVLEYLFSQGHVDTLDEALYVMMEMDSNTIYDICEQSFTINPSSHNQA